MGGPEEAANWNEQQFLSAIDRHLLKFNDYTVLDLTGFSAQQAGAVNGYLSTLSESALARLIVLGG